jgi:hypothetical protein
MKFIEGEFIDNEHHSKNTGCKSYTKAKNVNEGVQAVFPYLADRKQYKVVDHGSGGLRLGKLHQRVEVTEQPINFW